MVCYPRVIHLLVFGPHVKFEWVKKMRAAEVVTHTRIMNDHVRYAGDSRKGSSFARRRTGFQVYPGPTTIDMVPTVMPQNMVWVWWGVFCCRVLGYVLCDDCTV